MGLRLKGGNVPSKNCLGDVGLTEKDTVVLVADVRIFLAVADATSLSAAARQLDVVPMQVSRRIAALEEEVGVRLFHRTTRAVSLTAEGQAFLPYAHAMVEAEEVAMAELRPQQCKVAGVLRATAPSVLTQVVVRDVLPKLLEQHPELRVELQVSDSVVDIVGQGFDLALRVAPLADSGLVARRIAPNPRVICASPGYLRRFGRPNSVSDLAQHECIILQSVPRWPLQIAGKLQHCRVHGRLATNSVDTARAATIQGLGLVQLAYWDVAEQLQTGLLVEIVLDAAEPEQLSVWAVMPTRRFVPARVRIFLEMLEEEMIPLGLRKPSGVS